MSSDESDAYDIGDEEMPEEINHRVIEPKVPLAGKIYSVHVENFITFTDATLYPGEELNLLVGPNGTGKSSIVAAIVIGMGGSTKVLSTSKVHLSSYVKNGKDRAKVTVQLFKNERREFRTFTRSFGKDNKSNTYQIDNRKVSAEEYLRSVRLLNVQVDNLCQFLPQDRVQDFAKQNPQELFISTQNSVCNDEMVEQFKKLNELRDEQTTSATRGQKSLAKLHELEQRLEVLAEAVRAIKERDALTQKRDVIHMKVAWLDFEVSYMKCKEVQKDFELAESKYKKDAKAHEELVKSAEGNVRRRKQFETLHTNENMKVKKCNEELNRIISEMTAAKEAIKKAKDDLLFAQRSAGEHEREIEECRLIEVGLKGEYETMQSQCDSPEEHALKLQAIRADENKQIQGVERLNAARTQMNGEIDINQRKVVAIDNKLRVAIDRNESRMNFLRDRHPQVFRAMQWIRDNRQSFRGHIYDPIMIELNVKNAEHAKYVESTIAVRDLIAFTCTHVDDMNSLLKKLRVELRLNCNVIHSEEATSVKYRPQVPMATLERLGARSYLVDSIEGPAPIINYLCKTYNIQNTIIGSDQLELNSEQLPPSVQLFFADNDRITFQKSRYTTARSMMSTAIHRNNMLDVGTPPHVLQQLKKDREAVVRKMDAIRNKRAQIENLIKEREQELRILIAKRNELDGIRGKVQEAQKKWKMQSEKVARLERSGINVDAEKGKCATVVQQSTKKLITSQSNATTVYEKLTECSSREAEAKFRLDKFKASISTIDIQISSSNEQVERSKTYVDRVGNAWDTAKQETKKKQEAAMKLTNGHKPTEKNRFPYKQQFDELSNDVGELKDEADEIDAQLALQTAPQRETIREYEDRGRQLEQLKKEMANSEQSAANLERKIKSLHSKWFPAVQKIVESINVNFSHFMATMECAGEIELIRDSEHDYMTYGIEIRVKYRGSESLKPLDRNVQSGGERAVAIAVYSLSLQHMSQVPFRCVDEINQGMDSNNERRVFDMLVKIVARKHQSQFFYVTPKLLSNLSCNEYVTFCTVYNGVYSEHNDYFCRDD